MPCWVISSGRGFFHDYCVIVLCTYHFVVVNEAFSFEKLFLRSGRKITHLGEGENQKKYREIISSQEVWLLPSPLKISVYPELSCTTDPAEHLSLGIQLHYGSCYLFPPRTIVLCWAAQEGRDPHRKPLGHGRVLVGSCLCAVGRCLPQNHSAIFPCDPL